MNKHYETQRLILRPWKQKDQEPFAKINADPKVMEPFMLGCITREASSQLIKEFQEHLNTHGFGYWAVELKKTQELIGFTGIEHTRTQAHYTPAIHIGWRIASPHWNQGYATEAATKALELGFKAFNIPRIVATTPILNKPSERVMQKIGLQQVIDGDFPYPGLDFSHRLSHHILYAKNNPNLQQ